MKSLDTPIQSCCISRLPKIKMEVVGRIFIQILDRHISFLGILKWKKEKLEKKEKRKGMPYKSGTVQWLAILLINNKVDC